MQAKEQSAFQGPCETPGTATLRGGGSTLAASIALMAISRSTPGAQESSSRRCPYATFGDIIVESAKVGSGRRSGQIVEVLQGSAILHYGVQWEDGHQSEFFPGPNAMVVPPSS
jgi:Domain of unknown function (DUF1918)